MPRIARKSFDTSFFHKEILKNKEELKKLIRFSNEGYKIKYKTMMEDFKLSRWDIRKLK